MQLDFDEGRIVDRFPIQPHREKEWAAKGLLTHNYDNELHFSLQLGENVGSEFFRLGSCEWRSLQLLGSVYRLERFRSVIAFEHHAHKAPPDDSFRIKACLPGYLFAEARFVSTDASAVEKLRWNLEHCDKAEIDLFDRPQHRSYDNVLALSNERSPAMFRKA